MSNEFNFESLLIRNEVYAIIETSDKEHPVIIYSPNKEQRRMILNLILDNLKADKDRMTTDISGNDVVFMLLDELTNVHLGLDINNPEHQERVKRIVEDPSDLFLDINSYITKIINKQFYRYYDSLKQLSEMPIELREVYIDSIDKLTQENEEKIEITENEKQIIELEEKLKELKNKKEGK
jgi:hypothetical protein